MVLIVIDDTQEVAEMATGIASALKGNKVSVKNVTEFEGNDILPADVLFLGCKKPNLESFTYLSDLFKHINLAGRPCGVFSAGSNAAAKYLAALVHDSEAALKKEHLTINTGTGLKKWAQSVALGV